MSPYFLKESCGSSHNFKFYPDSYYEILEAILSEREVRRKKFLNASFLYKDGMREFPHFKSQDGVSIVDSKPETKSIPIIRWR
ncbi:hypothetical protein LEP1GSC040_0979 [Leptospira santarosai str. 2000030832]|nr:hypothetical protein LEP1GSC040_0979 [Leptospira santarosai str. 2000030832]